MTGDYEAERQRAVRAATGDVDRALRLMRRHDPQAFEDGFHLLADMAAEHIDRLIDEFRRAGPAERSTLLELIGEARSPQAYDLLAEHLASPDESLSRWAGRGLRKLDTKQARRLLWQHEQNRHATAS